jgi:hypothetical protein
MKVWDSCLIFEFGVCFGGSCSGLGFEILVWDPGFGCRFGIQVWGSGFGCRFFFRFGIQVLYSGLVFRLKIQVRD